jgi:hypothetical protein
MGLRPNACSCSGTTDELAATGADTDVGPSATAAAAGEDVGLRLGSFSYRRLLIDGERKKEASARGCQGRESETQVRRMGNGCRSGRKETKNRAVQFTNDKREQPASQSAKIGHHAADKRWPAQQTSFVPQKHRPQLFARLHRGQCAWLWIHRC